MENKKINFKILIIFIFLLLLSFSIIRIKKNELKNEENVEYEYLEKYESNQFVPVNISQNDMAVKYLNDYKNIMLSNLNEAYNLLNEEYKSKRFSGYEEFESFIKDKYSLSFYGTTVKKYKVEVINNSRFYYVYDSNDDLYIFKEKYILDYEVYLDDYSTEIK